MHFSKKEGHPEIPAETVRRASDRDPNPTLCPAFRVRRGSSYANGSMTRYVGSRASGYPPDFMPFRRSWSRADCDRSRANPSRAFAVLPSVLWGEHEGKS